MKNSNTNTNSNASNSNPKHWVDHTYWAEIDSPIKARILGLLIGDGTWSGGKHTYQIEQSIASSAAQLAYIRDSIGGVIYTRKTKSNRIIWVCTSAQHAIDLARYGFDPKKPKAKRVIVLDEIPKCYWIDVLCGCIDADGCISLTPCSTSALSCRIYHSISNYKQHLMLCGILISSDINFSSYQNVTRCGTTMYTIAVTRKEDFHQLAQRYLSDFTHPLCNIDKKIKIEWGATYTSSSTSTADMKILANSLSTMELQIADSLCYA